MRKQFILILLSVTLFSILSACNNNSVEEVHYTIGLVTNNNNGMINVSGFQEGMAKLGYVEGENTTYIFAGEPVSGETLTAVLDEMVSAKVDLIFTAGTPTGVAAYEATIDSDIPVVFGVIADPIAAGVMTDLNQPGGNMTGVMLSTNQARRLALLIETAPDIEHIFIVYNPDDAAATSAIAQIEDVTTAMELELTAIEASDSDGVLAALTEMPDGVDAIFMLPDSVVNAHLDEIVELSIERQVPVSAPSAIQVEGGALMAYGIIHHQVGVQAASIADQVLKGAKTGELPVQTAEFFLVINRETADAIGLEIPYPILQQAVDILGEPLSDD